MKAKAHKARQLCSVDIIIGRGRQKRKTRKEIFQKKPSKSRETRNFAGKKREKQHKDSVKKKCFIKKLEKIYSLIFENKGLFQNKTRKNRRLWASSAEKNRVFSH